MQSSGSALMGIGEGSGEDRAKVAAMAAISSPLLEASIDGATGLLINICGSQDLGIFEVNTAAQLIGENADPDAEIIVGTAVNPDLTDRIKITVIATGFDQTRASQSVRGGRRGTGASVSRNKLDEMKATPPPAGAMAPARQKEEDEDLDIPAFLRRRR